MKEIPTWVLESLCYHNPKNPDSFVDEDAPEYTYLPGDCSCDNCFYGRTKLAEYIIELYENK